MLIDIDLGIQAPDEDLPVWNAEDGDWETDGEDTPNGEDNLYRHCLSLGDAQCHQKGWNAPRLDYQTRIETERTHWQDQNEGLTSAYMEWMIHGPKTEDGADWFECRAITLKSEFNSMTHHGA